MQNKSCKLHNVIIQPSRFLIYSMGDIMNRGFVVKIRRLWLAFFIILTMAAVIILPNGAIGAKKGLHLCFSAVIPSLFLFTALSLFAQNSGAAKIISRPLSPLSRALFGLSGEEFSVFLLSLFSGYPVGAKLIAEMFSQNKIGRKRALIMLNYCVNAGPAFIVTAVGAIMLGSKSDGYRLLIAHILSSFLIMAALKPFIKKSGIEQKVLHNTEPQPLCDCFVRSVSAAASSILSVCAFVVLFSALGEIIAALPLPEALNKAIRAVLEVTVGASLFGRKQLGIIAFLLGFAGISVQFQVLAVTAQLKPSYIKLFFSRIAHGTLSYISIFIMEKFWPRSIKTSVPPGCLSAALSGDVSASAALLLMGIVLATFTFKEKNKNAMEK